MVRLLEMIRQFRVLTTGLLLLLALGTGCRAQMMSGSAMTGYGAALGLSPGAASNYAVHLVNCSAPGNILWPGDSATFTFQIVSTSARPIKTVGHLQVISYGTRGVPGDIWDPHVIRTGTPISQPVTINLAPNEFQDVVVTPATPARFGGYALVLDLGPLGRQFITSYARSFPVTSRRVAYPHMCLDSLPPPVLQRLGVHAIRYGMSYKPTTDPDFAAWYAARGKELRAYQAAGITVLFMVGGPDDWTGPAQPLHHQRPWLDDKGMMQNGKFDLAWMPSYDADFQEYCHRFAHDYGWPRGPVTAFSLWNEPWEGVSISGWGADMLRYREMYTHMWQGVNKARHEGSVVLVGGCDSSTNAMDKMFPDGTKTFGSKFDFLSVHYQGLISTANYKQWVDRKGYGGRVKIWDTESWDTESWVANTDDRAAAVVAGDRAAGYDRAMGVYGGNICTENDYDHKLIDGKTLLVQTVTTWSTAAAVGAASHFVGERPFLRMLFSNGLPWVMVFGGRQTPSGQENPEDGTVVVVGDLGEEFNANILPFRTARGYAEARHKAVLRKRLAAATAPDARQALEAQLAAPETLSDATMTLPASADYSLYDFYGNPVVASGGRIVLPLDGRGFFLRAGGRPGGFAHLLAALRVARVDGIQPLAIAAHDFTSPLETQHTLHLTLTNVLNRPVTGRLFAALGGLTVLPAAQTITFGPDQTREVQLPISGPAAPDNKYPLTVTFKPVGLMPCVYREELHANVIARRTITVDGDLSDWRGILPQTIVATGTAEPTLTEKAWLPFQSYSSNIQSGLATAYLAYDDENFYFAAKVADSTPDSGMVRFAARDDDQYSYPAVSYLAAGSGSHSFSIRWAGHITPKYTETYTFTTTSDDGVRLFVDGNPLITDWTGHGPTDDAAPLALIAGHHYALALEYYNGPGPGTAMLFWQSPSQPRQLIPAAAGGFTGQYFRDTGLTDLATTRSDPVINFQWADGAPGPAYTGNAGAPVLQPLTWPADVRRYTYRKNPDLPAGNSPMHDNIQITFNVLPLSAKSYYPAVSGTTPGFVSYQDTDYEYALNQVAPEYGGGTEVWRLAAPDIPHKMFYPRQPRTPHEGAVANAVLVIRREGDTLIYECSIPWTEMPETKSRLDHGQTIKFSYRVNDSAGGPTMELSKNRSVAKINNIAFHVD